MDKSEKKRREKIRKSMVGNSNGFKKGHKLNIGKKYHLGFKHTEETKKKLSDINKGKGLGNANGFKKGIPPWNKGKEMLNQRGEKCHFWRGGLTRLNNVRRCLEYNLWRKSILEKDNFTCQKYKIRGGELVAHHINNFAEFPELRFAINNGMVLSKKAHREFHKKYGVRNNTQEQLTEFLNN
jgi:thymidylate synthase (FAD)